MATKVFHVELRVPGVTDERIHAALKEAVRIKARELMGMATLVVGSSGTMPTIAAYSEDFIIGQDKIMVDTDTQEGDDD